MQNTQLSKPGETGGMSPCELTEKQKSQWRDTATMMVWQCPGFRHMWYKLLDNNKGEYTAVMSRNISGSPAATDAQNIIINPDEFFKYSLPQRVFIMGHEVVHNMYDDVGLLHRCTQSGVVPMHDGTSLPFDNATMQHAMDLRIDSLLILSKIGKPPQISLDRTKGLNLEKTANSSVLDQYKRLYKKPGDGEGGKGEGGKGEGGKGEGQGGKGFDTVLPPGKSTGQSPQQAASQRNSQQWAVEVAAAQMLESMRTQGKIPAALQRLFKDILEPEIDWTQEVSAEIARTCGTGNFNWKKGDRRFLAQDIFLPSQRGFGAGHIVIWGDTSGSRSDDTIASTIAEIAGILEDTHPKHLTVLWGDSEVAHVEELDEASDLRSLTPKGGGGTKMEPALEWVRDNCEEMPDMFMAFTDGYLTFPDEPAYPVLWVMNTDVKAPWGKTVRVMKRAHA